jgi:hypothetical protein
LRFPTCSLVTSVGPQLPHKRNSKFAPLTVGKLLRMLEVLHIFQERDLDLYLGWDDKRNDTGRSMQNLQVSEFGHRILTFWLQLRHANRRSVELKSLGDIGSLG